MIYITAGTPLEVDAVTVVAMDVGTVSMLKIQEDMTQQV